MGAVRVDKHVCLFHHNLPLHIVTRKSLVRPPRLLQKPEVVVLLKVTPHSGQPLLIKCQPDMEKSGIPLVVHTAITCLVA